MRKLLPVFLGCFLAGCGQSRDVWHDYQVAVTLVNEEAEIVHDLNKTLLDQIKKGQDTSKSREILATQTKRLDRAVAHRREMEKQLPAPK